MDNFEDDFGDDILLDEVLNSFYSSNEVTHNADDVSDDGIVEEDEVEEETRELDASQEEPYAHDSGFERYSIRLLTSKDKEYLIGKLYSEDLPLLESPGLRIYREGEETVESLQEERILEEKFLKQSETFLGSRRARRQASEGVKKLPPRARKKWFIECGNLERYEENRELSKSTNTLVGTLEGESASSYALIMLDERSKEADIVPLEKYCWYHFRRVPTFTRKTEVDLEQAEKKMRQQNKAEEKEFERLPSKEYSNQTMSSLYASQGNVSAKAESLPMVYSSGIESPQDYRNSGNKSRSLKQIPEPLDENSIKDPNYSRSSSRLRRNGGDDNEDIDYEEVFEDDDLSLGDKEEEEGLAEENTDFFGKQSLDNQSQESLDSSSQRKRTRSEDTASIPRSGSVSPSSLSSDSELDETPNLSRSGKEIERLLKKEKNGDSDSAFSKKRRLSNSTTNRQSSNLETIVVEILSESLRNNEPLTVREFTTLVTKRWSPFSNAKKQKGQQALDPQLLELIKRYSEPRRDPETQQVRLYVRTDALANFSATRKDDV
eukprot:jgi/Galph1/792/GphlegSOOS_G5541.1